MKRRTYISFDWAMKKLLRNKANFGILEGFLSTLLKFDIRIIKILESESNPDKQEDKSNKLDILSEDDNGFLYSIELQYHSQINYFQRMLYATSKLVTEYIDKGEPYDRIRKIYSVNILYFDLGQGTDYIYHGKLDFKGIHDGHTLQLSAGQRNLFDKKDVSDLYPEYYILKVNNFDDIAETTLDEWIFFLKNSELPQAYKAKGLNEVDTKMKYESMSKAEKKMHDKYMDTFVISQSELFTARYEGRQQGREEGRQQGREEGRQQGREEGRQQGREEALIDVVKNIFAKTKDINQTSKILDMTVERVKKILRDADLES